MSTYTQPTDVMLLQPENLADDLAQVLDSALPRLRQITDLESQQPRESGKWSPRQIIGHLIDSACNNHQRFVRLQIDREIHLPGYKQTEWVAVQCYAERPWKDLLNLWEGLNRHLVHVIAHTQKSHLAHEWITADQAWTLGFLIEDYIAHMGHHLLQILPE
ncbi:MAG: DinB family protein [Acidobacteria bacterium]|nr:DinB family protein [Acidobacteriota bacterium]